MAYTIGNQADRDALLTEVTNDTRSAGLSLGIGTADLLNILNDVSLNPASDTVNVPLRDLEIIASLFPVTNIDATEYNSLTGANKKLVDEIIALGIQDPTETFGVDRRKIFRDCFNAVTDPTESTTWANIKSDRSRDASIGEALFGRDTVISRDDWFDARDNGVVA